MVYCRQSAGYIIGNRQLIRQGNKLKPFPEVSCAYPLVQILCHYKQRNSLSESSTVLILPVRVFLLRSLSGHDRSLPCASSPSGNYSPPMLAIPVFPVASSCSLWSWVSSTVSRYSFCSDGEAAHPISALLSSCSLSRSSMISCLHCKMGGLYLVSCILYLLPPFSLSAQNSRLPWQPGIVFF